MLASQNHEAQQDFDRGRRKAVSQALSLATKEELREGFPDLTADQLYCFGRRRGLKRPRIQWLRSGDKLLDDLRDECWRLGITMADLDEFTGTSNRYFAQHRWCRSPVRHDFVLRAIREMGGKVISGQVKWPGRAAFFCSA
ncbi:hypothetical protein AJ88_45735 [Mesorhizobium amorphae CCBAU 01583]|nr:hypothetical protein AJ88_45735 [Mesorhizobium amorphae CCBAU 01583]